MKKTLAILLALVLMLSAFLLAGCGKKDDTQPPVTEQTSTEKTTQTDITKPTDPTAGWETYELNMYATIKIDPDVATMQGDGSVTANDETWAWGIEFATDENLYSYYESMFEGQEVESKHIGDYDYRIVTFGEDGYMISYYVAEIGLENLSGMISTVEYGEGTPRDDAEAMLATLAIDEESVPDVPESFGAEPGGPRLEDWAVVTFDEDAADLTYHTIEAKDGSWSIEFNLPTTETGLAMYDNDYNLISKGYGDQTDIKASDETLGDYTYKTLRYNQDGKACAYYSLTFETPLQVEETDWEGTVSTVPLYGIYALCKADAAADLADLADIVASLYIMEA